MFPEPASPQDEPGVAAQVQFTVLRSEGKLSVTVAPVTAEGPSLPATIVYVNPCPAPTSEELAALVTQTSADCEVVTVVCSTLVLLLETGSDSVALTEAAFVRVPAPAGAVTWRL